MCSADGREGFFDGFGDLVVIILIESGILLGTVRKEDAEDVVVIHLDAAGIGHTASGALSVLGVVGVLREIPAEVVRGAGHEFIDQCEVFTGFRFELEEDALPFVLA